MKKEYGEEEAIVILRKFCIEYSLIAGPNIEQVKTIIHILLNYFDDRTVFYAQYWGDQTLNNNYLASKSDRPYLLDALKVLIERRIFRIKSEDAIMPESLANTEKYLVEHADTKFCDLFYLDKGNLDLELKQTDAPSETPEKNIKPNFEESAAIMANVDCCSSINIETDSPVGAYLKLIIPNEKLLVPKDMVKLFKEMGEVTNKYGIPIVIDDHTDKKDTKTSKYTFDDAAKIAILSGYYKLTGDEMDAALTHKTKLEEFESRHCGILTALSRFMSILSEEYHHWMFESFDRDDKYYGTIVGVQYLMGGASITRVADCIEILHRVKAIRYNPLVIGDDVTIQDHIQDLLYKKITTYILFCEEEIQKCLK